MELQLLSSPSLVFITTLFIASLLMLLNKLASKCKPPPPPGPPTLPIIGSMHYLFSSLPHRRFRDLSLKYGPIMLLRLGQVDHIVISSRDAAEEVLKTNDINFASRPDLAAPKILSYGNSNIAFSPYNNNQKQLKRIVIAELLNPQRVKSTTSLREEEVSNLIEDISASCENGLINLSEKIRELFNTVVARVAFGKKCRHQRRFIAVTKEAMRLITGFSVLDMFPYLGVIDVVSGVRFRLERVHREFDEILGEIIREHSEKKKDKMEEEEEEEDLVDVLLRVKEHGNLEIPLTVNNLKGVILDIFVGGTESSGVLIEWAMAELMRHPKIMAKAQDEVRRFLKGKAHSNINEHISAGELSYLDLVLKETLRLHPPARVCLVGCICKCNICKCNQFKFPPKNEWPTIISPKSHLFSTTHFKIPAQTPNTNATCNSKCILPNTPLIPRACRETCTVQGYTITSGTRVTINAFALGRDPQCWDDADIFKPERFDASNVDFKRVNYEFLPFGAGRRICPGITYAMINNQLALAKLLLCFDWKLPNGMKPEELDMTENFAANTSRKQDLLLVATPYAPSTI